MGGAWSGWGMQGIFITKTNNLSALPACLHAFLSLGGEEKHYWL